MTKQINDINDVIEPCLDYFMDAQFIIKKHENKINKHQYFLAIIALICIIFSFNFNDFNFLFVFIKNLIFSFLFFYSSLSVIFVKTIEKKNLKRTIDLLNITASLFQKSK